MSTAATPHSFALDIHARTPQRINGRGGSLVVAMLSSGVPAAAHASVGSVVELREEGAATTTTGGDGGKKGEGGVPGMTTEREESVVTTGGVWVKKGEGGVAGMVKEREERVVVPT